MQSSCLASASSSLDGSRKQFRQWNTPSDLVPAIRAIGQWYWQIDIVHMLQSRLDEAIVWLEKARRGPGLCETRTLCWRNRDSNAWSPATSMMPARPSLAPGAHARSGRRDQLVHRGDRPAASPCLTQTRPLQVESREFRAGVRRSVGGAVDDEQRRKILCDNCARLYAIETPAVPLTQGLGRKVARCGTTRCPATGEREGPALAGGWRCHRASGSGRS